MTAIPLRIQDNLMGFLITTDILDHSGIHSVVGDSSGSQCLTRLVVCLLLGLAFRQALPVTGED